MDFHDILEARSVSGVACDQVMVAATIVKPRVMSAHDFDNHIKTVRSHERQEHEDCESGYTDEQ